MQDDSVDVATSPPARVLHSDPHDFAGLYIRHRSSFTLHARRYLRDARDADEVVQEAFLRLFLALPELETELQALAYCRRTITNLCIDRYRAQARRPHLVDLDSVAPDELAEDELDDPVVRAEDAAIVRAALSMLSPLHRAALVKREIEEKTLPVIAAELEIPEESVKHLLFRARRALRRVLAGTSVAPALVAAARKSSGGIGAIVLLLAAGLSTGPDLRMVPAFGADLPDLPSISEVVREVVTAIAGPSGDGGAPDATVPADDPVQGPLLVPVSPSASPSPSASASTSPAPSPSVSPSSAPEPATGTVTIDGSASPSPSPTSTVLPTAAPLPSASPSGSAQPSPSASPTASSSPSASPAPTAAERLGTSSTSPAPSSDGPQRPRRAPQEFAAEEPPQQ